MRQGRVTIRVGILCHKPIGPHSEDMLLICRVEFSSLTLPSKVLELSVQPTGSEHDYISYSDRDHSGLPGFLSHTQAHILNACSLAGGARLRDWGTFKNGV